METLAQRIRTTRLFGHLTVEQLLGLLHKSRFMIADAGDILVKEEESQNNHLLLLSGKLEAQRTWSTSGGYDRSYTWHLNSTGQNGEFSYLCTMTRVRARALSSIKYILIPVDEADVLLGWTQQIKSLLGSNSKLNKLVEVCQNSSVFHQLPLENIKAVMQKLQPIQVKANHTLMKQGEKGDYYYIMENGIAEVHQTDDFTGEMNHIANLGPGDAFGEIALIQDGFRNATITTVTPANLYKLSKADFDELIKPGFVDEINADDAYKLIQTGQAQWIDCRYDIEYEESRIPNAPLIPLPSTSQEASKLDPNVNYIVYCRSGRRSKAAVYLYRERNINAISLTGGIKDWPHDLDVGAISEYANQEIA